MRKSRALALLGAAFAAIIVLSGSDCEDTGGTTPSGNNGLSEDAKKRAILSTVRILTPIEGGTSMGSGTIVDQSGLILTNWHVIGDTDKGTTYHSQGLSLIAPTTNVNTAPVPGYVGQIVAGDPKLDIAVLKIVGIYNGQQGQPLPGGAVSLPWMEIGNSDQVKPLDYVAIFGYPMIGGETINITDGKISGMEDQDGDGATDLFKTDASISSGNSGGLAVNASGQQIGIPTYVRVHEQAQATVGKLRKVNLAQPFIDRAKRGEPFTIPSAAQAQPAPQPYSPAPVQPTPQTEPQPPAQTTGGFVSGLVTDANTQQPVGGANFFVLQAGVTLQQIQSAASDAELQALIAASAVTTAEGTFVTAPAIAPGTYTVLVGAQGYASRIFQNGLTLEQGTQLLRLDPITIERQQ